MNTTYQTYSRTAAYLTLNQRWWPLIKDDAFKTGKGEYLNNFNGALSIPLQCTRIGQSGNY